MTTYWDQAELGATEDDLDRKADNLQWLMDHCGHIFFIKHPQTGLKVKRVLLCHKQDCDNCLTMRADKERKQLEKGMVDFGTIRVITLDADQNPAAFIRRLGRAGITKDMRRRLPQEDGSTIIFFVCKNDRLGGRIVTEEDMIAYNWKQMARRPDGTRTSGALGAERPPDQEDDRDTLKIQGVSSSNATDDQEEKAEREADESIAGIEPDSNNLEALCNKWAAEFASALIKMGCSVSKRVFYVRCDLDAISWSTKIEDNQPSAYRNDGYANYWVNAYAGI